jgi:hypothetical protein
VPAVLAALSAVSFAQPVELTASQRLVNSVFAGTARVDHIASLEGYDYYVYVDRSVSPPAAAYRLTEDSLEKMTGLKKGWSKYMALQRRQHQLIKSYVNQIERGEAPSQVLPEPTSEPAASSEEESPDARTIEGCPRVFPKADRSQGHVVAIQDVKVDEKGRPWAWHAMWSGHVTPGQRFPGCQSDVGHMGKKTDVGGHMIGAQLGGWGKRANLVPQDAQLNATGSGWSDIDTSIAFCAERGFLPDYNIWAMYDDRVPNTVRPIAFTNVLAITLPTFPPETKEYRIDNQPNALDPRFTMAMKNIALGTKAVCSAGGGGCGLGEGPCKL